MLLAAGTRGRRRARGRKEGRRRSQTGQMALTSPASGRPAREPPAYWGGAAAWARGRVGPIPLSARSGSLRSRRFLRCSPERRHCLGEQRREVVESLGCPFAPGDSLSRTCSGGVGGRSYGEAGEGLAWVPLVTFLYPGERLGWGQRRSSHSSQGCQLRRGTTRCRRILC